MFKWCLNLILFMSIMYGGFFYYKAAQVFSTCMLKKDEIVTPTLQIGKNYIG